MKKRRKSRNRKYSWKSWSSNQCSEIILMGWAEGGMNNEENNHGLEPDLPLFLMITNFLIMNFSSSDFLQWCLIFLCLLYRKPLLWWPRSIMGSGKQTPASPYCKFHPTSPVPLCGVILLLDLVKCLGQFWKNSFPWFPYLGYIKIILKRRGVQKEKEGLKTFDSMN